MEVFSIEKFIKDLESVGPSAAKESLDWGWPYKIEGKTYKEIEAMGYETHPDWMKEQK